MIIREAQIEGFRAQQRLEQWQFLCAFLREELALETAQLSEEALARHCFETIEICAELGLPDHRSAAWLATMRLLFHPRVHEHPRLRGLLADPGTPPERRLENLLAESSPLDWQEAAAMSPGPAHEAP